MIKGKFHDKARCPALALGNDAMWPWKRELPDLSPLRVLQSSQAESLRFLITTRQPTQILPTGKQNNACGWNAVDGAPKKTWIWQIATQPEGIKFLVQQNPIKPSKLQGKCVKALSLNQPKKVFASKHRRYVCVPSVCSVKHFLTCLIPIPYFGCRNGGTGRWDQDFSELAHFLHYL